MSVIVVIIFLGVCSIQEVASVELTPEERDRLLKGESIVYLKAVSGPIKEGTAIGLINMSPERVFRVITDNENFEEFMPYVEKSDVERTKEGSIINYQYLDLPFPIGDRYYKINVVHTTECTNQGKIYKSTWSYVNGSGNIKDTYGHWTLEKYDQGKTLATYVVCTDPGGSIPKWAQNMATKISLPEIIDRVRQRVRNPKYEDQ